MFPPIRATFIVSSPHDLSTLSHTLLDDAFDLRFI